MAVQAYLLEHRVDKISWHTVLNNHASTRPQIHGGPAVSSVKNCKEIGCARPCQCRVAVHPDFAEQL